MGGGEWELEETQVSFQQNPVINAGIPIKIQTAPANTHTEGGGCYQGCQSSGVGQWNSKTRSILECSRMSPKEGTMGEKTITTIIFIPLPVPQHIAPFCPQSCNSKCWASSPWNIIGKENLANARKAQSLISFLSLKQFLPSFMHLTGLTCFPSLY